MEKQIKIGTYLKPEILTHPNIPKPLHEVNPRNIMGKEKWDAVRQEVYKASDYHCVGCGVSKQEAKKYKWIEAHEYYNIDYKKGKVEITSLEALCHYCHNFIHSGRLRMIVGKEKSYDEVKEILEHGFKVLGENKLKCFPYTKKFAEDIGADTFSVKAYKLKPSYVEWEDWRMVWGNKEYPPKYKSYQEWLSRYR